MILSEYTAENEIGWSADSIVYEASRASGPADGQPLALKVRGYHQESEGAALLEAAREQERAVASGCVSIVPVLALGLERNSFFCVTPRYSRSLLSLIEGKVTVRPEGLQVLASKILAALRQLRERQGRAHGNLKASNVLLSSTAQLRESDVFLSDFSTEKTSRHAADLGALGHIIYQLVRRRQIKDFDWPIASSSHWIALGPQGEEVRAFCNALLDPALARMPDPLLAAEMSLAKLAGGRSSFPWKPIVIGAAVLMLAAAGWFGGRNFFNRSGISKPAVNENAALAEDAWIGQLAEELKNTGTQAGEDNFLESRLLAPIRNLHLSNSEIAALKKGANRSETAAKTVREVRAAWETWDAPQVVSRGYEDLAALGWTLPAGSISRLRGYPSAGQPVLPQLRAVSHAAVLLPQVQLKWRILQETLEQLEKSEDPILARVPAYAGREAATAPDLDRLFAGLQSQSDRFPSFLTLLARADRSRLQAEGKLAQLNGPITSEVLREWEKETRSFIPDPAAVERLRSDWQERFDDLAARLATVGGDAPRLLRDLSEAKAAAEASLKGMLPVDAERLDGIVQAQLVTLAQKIQASALSSTGMMTASPEIKPPPSSVTPMAPDGSVPVLPQMTPGDHENFERLLAQLRDADLSGKSGGAMRALRDNFVEGVRQSTSAVFQKEIAPFLKSLSALTFREASAAPSLPAWTGPAASATGVSYSWSKYKLEFTLIPAEGEKSPYFLAAQELPMGLLIDWMNEHGGNWTALDLRASPTVRGPRGWEQKGPGITVRRDWTWPAILGAGFTFYPAPPKGALPEPPTGMMPLNYISFRTASAVAEQFGARLPFSEEWMRAYRFAKSKGWDGGEPNLRDARWEQQRVHVVSLLKAGSAAGAALRDPPWPDGDIFIPSDQRGLPRGEKARPARSEDDRFLWFRSINAGTPQPLKDLVGNVAEFAADPDGGRCYVIGGSALSPPELDPATPYPLSPAQRSIGYSDVGIRLALSAGGGNGPGRDQEEDAFRRVLLAAPAKKPQ